MAKYLFAWELGTGLGHCINLMPIAAGLLLRGHTVYVAARDLTAATKVLGHLPVKFLQAPFLSGRFKPRIAMPRSYAHILINTCCDDQYRFEILLSAWRNIFELVGPDVVVCEHAPMALIASRLYTVRRVIIGTGFFSPPAMAPLPDLRPWLPKDIEGLQSNELAVLERINKVLDAAGQPTMTYLAQMFADADENFLLTFEELDHYGQRPTAEYWGMWSPIGGDEPHWPECSGPRVFAYLKPATADWKPETIFSALQKMDVSALVYLPEISNDLLKQFTSHHIRISTSPIDARKAARQCDLAVLNGNAGTATECLRAGVPLLNAPIFLEQTIFSFRVAKIGAGLVVQPDHPEQIADHFSRLLSASSFRESARKFSERYISYDPTAAAEQILYRLNLLAGRRAEDSA